MKKQFFCVLIVLILAFCLTGCDAEEKTIPIEESKVVSDISTEAISDTKDLVTGESLALHNGAVVLHNETVLERENEYKIDGVYSEILTDRAIDRGWEYYYLDTEENGKPVLSWIPSEGSFTSVLVMFDCTNLAEQPCKFGDMINIWLVFDEDGNEKNYKGTLFQANPNQISEEGYDMVRSTVYKEINKDEVSVISCLIDVDRSFHDAVVAEEVKEPIWVYIDFSNGQKYCIDLREEMVIFGYDDSDDESAITSDAYRVMKSAVGAEFLGDYLQSKADFADAIKKAGKDVNEAAEDLASLFSMKINDIWFSNDSEATVYCTVTSPDLSQFNQNIDNIQNNTFPVLTRDIELEYKHDDELDIWMLIDREMSMNNMRFSL